VVSLSDFFPVSLRVSEDRGVTASVDPLLPLSTVPEDGSPLGSGTPDRSRSDFDPPSDWFKSGCILSLLSPEVWEKAIPLFIHDARRIEPEISNRLCFIFSSVDIDNAKKGKHCATSNTVEVSIQKRVKSIAWPKVELCSYGLGGNLQDRFLRFVWIAPTPQVPTPGNYRNIFRPATKTRCVCPPQESRINDLREAISHRAQQI
jgi:hypothetical protein